MNELPWDEAQKIPAHVDVDMLQSYEDGYRILRHVAIRRKEGYGGLINSNEVAEYCIRHKPEALSDDEARRVFSALAKEAAAAQ
ncbi:hypothetical protein CSQ85_00235 [Bifidobacterium rousetti]|nr:hypothetical protein CSQ85_00235 [Bifidobacterium rousetti]